MGTAASMGPRVLVTHRVKLACVNLLGISFYVVKTCQTVHKSSEWKYFGFAV